MTLLGSIKNGRIELDAPCGLPEGARVQVELSLAPMPAPDEGDLAAMMLKYAGKAVGLPADAARNHDHYLYGTRQK